MRKRTLLIGVFTAVVGALGLGVPAIATDDPQPMIVGGHDATEQYSFMVSLQYGGRHWCGASLIRSNWVVTAAHCVSGDREFTVRVGSNQRDSGGETAKVVDEIVHPRNDLAVLELGRSVQAEPIEIAATSGKPGTETRILGWGQTCPERGCGAAPQTLQALETKIISDSDCLNIYGPKEICTNNPGGDAGACYGDSGGPQIKGTAGNWKLIGATSRSGNNDATCATGPSIYTDVSAHKDWILNQIGS